MALCSIVGCTTVYTIPSACFLKKIETSINVYKSAEIFEKIVV